MSIENYDGSIQYWSTVDGLEPKGDNVTTVVYEHLLISRSRVSGLSTEAWAKLWINNFHIMTNIALLTVQRACLLMSPVSNSSC